MRRLVRGFDGRTYHIVGNLMHWLIFNPFSTTQDNYRLLFGSLYRKNTEPDQTADCNWLVVLASMKKNQVLSAFWI